VLAAQPLERFIATGRFADLGNTVLRFEKLSISRPDNRVIIGNEYS
jgi:hypothetical protein